MGRPLQTLLPPALSAEPGRAVALAVLRDPQADVRLAQGLTLAQSTLRRVPTLRSLVVSRRRNLLLQELARTPYVPERTLLRGPCSRRPPFRRLNRELMLGTLVDYTCRIRSTLFDPNAGRNSACWGGWPPRPCSGEPPLSVTVLPASPPSSPMSSNGRCSAEPPSLPRVPSMS